MLKILYQVEVTCSMGSLINIFTAGLTHKRQGNFEDALESFLKLQSIVGHEPQVLFQVANLQELLGDSDQAVDWSV
jgi:intraflagellar transport protein 88